MDAYDRCTNLGEKNLANIVAIYGQGRELFRPPMYNGPSPSPGPQSGSQNKDGRLSWLSVLWHTFMIQKSHLPTNTTEIIGTFHKILLHPCWSLAKKQMYDTLRSFIKNLQCKRRLSVMSNCSVYDAAPCREMNVISWLFHYLGAQCLIHCFTLLMNSK
jgi:hypothetical protein